MLNLYEKNGLVFWTEDEIASRRMFEHQFMRVIYHTLKGLNRAFEFFQIEAPLLTPAALVNQKYTAEGTVYAVDEGLVLRPETTMGSYAYARHLLTSHTGVRLPLVVWQHGKSFRREQDQPTKHMRLKEFCQLEFQIMYSLSTKNDYSPPVVEAVRAAAARMLGPCRTEPSDRLPEYAEWTTDVVLETNGMELASISKRKDFDLACVLEVAIGTDRCVANFLGA